MKTNIQKASKYQMLNWPRSTSRPTRIKARHGEGMLLHVFPALPASLAVEVGRVWMPKSDLPLRLYVNNRSHGFISTFDIP